MKTVVPAKKRKNPYKRVQDIAFWTLPPLLLLSAIGAWVAGLMYADSIGAFERIEIVETRTQVKSVGWEMFGYIGGLALLIASLVFIVVWGGKALDRWRDQRREWDRRARND